MTVSDRADLLVVGASFAGVACAIEAARAGLRVILIERKADAGEKLHTTGIVVKEAADELERIGHFPPELIRPIRGVRLYGSRLASVALDSPGYFFLATDTPNLMRWLIEQAIQAGVDVRLGTLFTGARREARWLCGRRYRPLPLHRRRRRADDPKLLARSSLASIVSSCSASKWN